VKKLVLGTAQFGMFYGISNQEGKTHFEEVAKILSYAHEHGVDSLDTASLYGDSEIVLGRVLKQFSKNSFHVISKTPHFNSNVIASAEVSLLRATFDKSLSHLGVSQLDGLLIHACDDLFVENGFKLYRELELLRDQGKVRKIGVSIYSSQQISDVLDEFSVDFVQLPINALDQRLIEDGSLDRLKEKNVEVHARSVFLQGLLLMPVKNISPWFAPIMPMIKRFHALAQEMELSPLQLALGFVNALEQVDRVVVGVNNVAQLHEMLEAESALINVAQCQELSVQDPKFTNPGNWQV